MPKRAAVLTLLAATFLSITACNRPTPITQDELVRRTQQIVDSIVPGDQAPWKKYYAEDAMYFDEKGRAIDKKALLADVSPMPAGYSGAIKIVNARSHIDGDTAILTYDMDESETVFGQQLHARYHSTDTWRYRRGEWQIVAGQVLRYYEDPAPGPAEERKFADYAGVYELAPGRQRSVLAEPGHLYTQRGDRPKEELLPEAGDIFFRRGVEGRILFRYGKNGKVDVLIDRRNNEDVVWKKMK